MDFVTYANQGATRRLPLSGDLVEALSFLPELGVRAEVFSGGQPAIGSGAPRVGSTRHDHGNAADVFFYQGDRRLDWNNPDDLPIFQDIVRRGRQAGLTGFGAGDGYMQPGSMHIGFGTPAVWGAGGRGANAPDWLRDTYYSAGEAGARPDVVTAATDALYGPEQGPNQPSAPAGRTDSTISTRGPEPMQEYQPEKAGGILGMLFPKMTADRQDSIALALSGLGRGNPALEANLRDRMGGRRDDRKEFEQQQQQRAQMNRTLQVLGQAGFDEQDLALAAENPEYMRAMVGQLAKRKLAGEQQPKWEWNSDLGQYVDMNDPTNTYAPQGAGTTPPTLDKDQMSILGGLSDDATRDLKTSEELRSSYNRIQSFADGQSVSDVALVTAFAKLLDPGSVVREGEAVAIAQSGSLPDAFKQSMLNALTGQGQLPPEVKQEIVSLSRKLYYDTASDARSTIEGYQGRAARAGLGDEKVYLGSEFTSPAQPQSSLRPQTRPGQFSAQQAGPTISREQLQSAVGKLSAYDRELLNSIPGAQEKLRFLQEKGVLP